MKCKHEKNSKFSTEWKMVVNFIGVVRKEQRKYGLTEVTNNMF